MDVSFLLDRKACIVGEQGSGEEAAVASTSSSSSSSSSSITTSGCWSPLSVAALDMAVCGWYGLNYYSVLAADAALAAAAASSSNYDQPPRAKRRKVVEPALTSADTTTRLLFDRRGRVTFKPYSDIRLDSSLQNRAGETQPLKRRYGDYVATPSNNRGVVSGKKTADIQPDRGCTIGNLFPEILSEIFEYLDLQSKGRVAQVSTRWRDAAYKKSVWRNMEARLHLNRSNPTLFPSLVKRGIKRIQVLSLRKSPRELVNGIPNIESLNLSGCYNLSDAAVDGAFIRDVSSLTTLNLSLCKEVTDNSLGRIATNCKNLESVDLGGCCKITNAGLLLIAWGLKKIKRLNLRSCRQISDQGIEHLCSVEAHHPGSVSLEELCLQDCQKLTDESLKFIADGLPKLKKLNLSFCVSITDTGLKSLARLPSLEDINLRSCDNVSDIGVGFLAEDGHALQQKLMRLDVSFCGNVTDAGLRHIATGLTSLRSLSMTTCAISDDGLSRLAKNLSNLQELNIGQCVNVSNQGLRLLAEGLKSLSSLDLYGCPRVTEVALNDLKKQLPRLAHLNLTL